MASVPVFAQSSNPGTKPPPRVLTQASVDKFISDLPGLMKDFKALGDEYEAQTGTSSGDPSAASPDSFGKAMAAIRADSRAMAILKRHGWKDSFWQVYGAVFSGYFVVMMDDAYAQSQQPAMKQYADQYRATVNPEDAALVAKNKDRIQQVFEGMQENG